MDNKEEKEKIIDDEIEYFVTMCGYKKICVGDKVYLHKDKKLILVKIS